MIVAREDDHLRLVTDLAQGLFAPGIAVVVRDPRQMPRAPDSSEARAVSGAIPTRQTEFHAGRAAARAAMVALGLPPRPVPVGPDRAPIWPDGVVASLTHDARACIAVMGLAEDWRGLGIDLEDDAALDLDLVSDVCSVNERAWLDTLPAARRGLMAKLIFSAKEASYKAQYPLTGQLFGFDGFEIEIDEPKTAFTARFTMPTGIFQAGDILRGRYAHAAGVLVSGVTLTHLDMN